jgi:predicted RND superfamily exporter protein
MSIHPTLTLTVYILAAVVFALVVLYWILYTRRLKTPRNTGTQAGIAIPTQKNERTGKAGAID